MEPSPTPGVSPLPPSSWTRSAVFGLFGGVVGAVVMAAFAMAAAATFQGTGFFTPLYHIGSAFGWGESAEAMGVSMDQASGGDLYYFTTGPASLGMAIHLVTGAGWGFLFGLVVRAARITRSVMVHAGVAFGLLVLVVMSYLVLPAVAALFDSGAPIRDMAAMVGWWTFAAEHGIFGLVLGLVGLKIVSRTATVAPRATVEPSR